MLEEADEAFREVWTAEGLLGQPEGPTGMSNPLTEGRRLYFRI
jgi:hypothetical protein